MYIVFNLLAKVSKMHFTPGILSLKSVSKTTLFLLSVEYAAERS